MDANKMYKNKIVPLKKPTFFYRQHDKNIHLIGSQNGFRFVTIGDNPNLIGTQNKIVKDKNIVKIKSILYLDPDYYCVHITDPEIYLNNKDSLLFKRIIIHWDTNNMNKIPEFKDYTNIYNVTYVPSVLDTMKNNSLYNCKLLSSKEDLLSYLREDDYTALSF